MNQNAYLIFAPLLVAILTGAAQGNPVNCESLSSLTLKDTRITSAQTVAAGAFVPPGSPAPEAASFSGVPAFCRVTGVSKPSPDSNIEFEVWMPSSGWNGKFHGVGNGGFAGSISYGPRGGMAEAVSRGYATASTDTGHKGSSVDGSWALGHPEKVIDFGYRAIHLTTANAKEIIRTFYGENPRRSYFNSCSNGGRQALMEAQRFPSDYDGIISGAPANFWTHLTDEFIWNMQATVQDSASYIPATKLPAIDAAALAACDARDGVQDGVIDSPDKCRFNPSKLLCQGPESDSCLTEPQVTALSKIYAGPQNRKGESIYPGDLPGGEAGPGGWSPWITGRAPRESLQFIFATQFLANMVFEDPAWDYRTFQFDRDTKIVDDKMSRLLNAMDPNLKPFSSRGGKLIMYHGWSDAAISAVNSVNYYNAVAAQMGTRDTDSFLRLFMAPGMQHCGGGPGPNMFMGRGVPPDADHDMDLALERWVESGIAPEKLIATKYKKDGDSSSEVLRTRPLCPYPQVARYKGTGSTDDAANFVCSAVKP